MNGKYVVGVDIGGSHVTASLVDMAARTIVNGSQIRRAVDPHAAAEDIINNWSEVIKQVATVFEDKPYYTGIAMPGPFDYEKGISLIKGFNKYESLYELNVKEMLAQVLGIAPGNISLKNDAAAFLQGEIFCGAAAGYNKAIGLTLGTGLGSAHAQGLFTKECAVNVSSLHEGRAEDYISILWFRHRYHELTGYMPSSVKYIADRIGEDSAAARVFDEFSTNLSIVLKRFIKEEEPDIVVLGGGIANAFDIFYPTLQLKLGDAVRVPVKQSVLGEDAAMAGAAGNWIHTIQQSTIL